MKIIIVRHGKPEKVNSGSILASDLGQWIDSYNTSPLDANSRPSSELKEIAHSSGGLACSSLRRSVESAEILCREKIILQSELFSEAELPFTNLGRLKLSPKVWAVLFRVWWMTGYSNNAESRAQAQVRARDAANELIHLAKTHQQIIYIGHGIFNRMVAAELLHSGWQGPRNPSSAHWGHSIYTISNPDHKPK